MSPQPSTAIFFTGFTFFCMGFFLRSVIPSNRLRNAFDLASITRSPKILISFASPCFTPYLSPNSTEEIMASAAG